MEITEFFKDFETSSLSAAFTLFESLIFRVIFDHKRTSSNFNLLPAATKKIHVDSSTQACISYTAVLANPILAPHTFLLLPVQLANQILDWYT